METQSKKLKALLRNTKLPEPEMEFTEEVVREIRAIEEGRVYIDERMVDVLKKTSLTTPPNDFTYRVLNNVQGRPVGRADEPVISWKAWMGIGVFVVVCVVVALLSEGGGIPSGSSSSIDIGRYMNSFFLRFRDPVEYLFIVLISIGLLLRLDVLINKKRTSNRLNSTPS